MGPENYIVPKCNNVEFYFTQKFSHLLAVIKFKINVS